VLNGKKGSFSAAVSFEPLRGDASYTPEYREPIEGIAGIIRQACDARMLRRFNTKGVKWL
jgi:hypothetical protein